MSIQCELVRVLVVDDEPMLRKLLCLLLERSGRYTVVGTAGDGLEAIEHAQQLHPDVVLLDLSMPRMDGLEALPHLRAALPAARLVVLSGFAARGAAQAATDAGAHAYLEKGLSPTALIAALDEAVGLQGGDATPRTPTAPPIRAASRAGYGQREVGAAARPHQQGWGRPGHLSSRTPRLPPHHVRTKGAADLVLWEDATFWRLTGS